MSRERSGNVIVRAGTPADAEALAALHCAAWRAAYAELLPRDVLEEFEPARRLPLWQSLLGHPDRAIVQVAERPGQGACGLLWMRRTATEGAAFSAEIIALAVDPAQQRQGIGRRLMAAAAAELAARDLSDVYLWVYRDNRPARAFYEKLGGRLVDEDQEHYRDLSLPIVAYAWKPLRDLETALARPKRDAAP